MKVELMTDDDYGCLMESITGITEQIDSLSKKVEALNREREMLEETLSEYIHFKKTRGEWNV